MKTIHDIFDEHLKSHTICEICKNTPSIRISRWGQILAVCNNCANKELKEFYEYCNPKIKSTGITCPDCHEPYLEQSSKTDWCLKCGHYQGY